MITSTDVLANKHRRALDWTLLDIGLLALVAGRDVEPGEIEGSWKIEQGVAKHRVISTVDPETRHMHRSRSLYRYGYNAHVAVEPDTGLITACDLTPANEGDGLAGIKLLANEPKGLDVPADSAYGSGDSLAALGDAEHQILIKPWPLGRNSKLGDDQFDRDDFIIDYTARTITCPNAVTVNLKRLIALDLKLVDGTWTIAT